MGKPGVEKEDCCCSCDLVRHAEEDRILHLQVIIKNNCAGNTCGKGQSDEVLCRRPLREDLSKAENKELLISIC